MKRLLIVLALVALPVYGGDFSAPPFTLVDDSGKEISLPQKRKGVEVLLFWASWCPYCNALMPHLQSIQIEYGDKVRVYALNIRDDEDPREFLDKRGYDFVLLPKADAVMKPYGVRGTPGLFLIDDKGLIRFNLYEVSFARSGEFKKLNNRGKAGRLAPYWAAEIRNQIDQILKEASGD